MGKGGGCITLTLTLRPRPHPNPNPRSHPHLVLDEFHPRLELSVGQQHPAREIQRILNGAIERRGSDRVRVGVRLGPLVARHVLSEIAGVKRVEHQLLDQDHRLVAVVAVPGNSQYTSV